MSTSRARSRALATAAAASLAAGLVAVPAHADSLSADGDTLTPGADVALGEIPCGQAVPFDAALALVRAGVPGTTPVFANGATVAFDAGTASGMPPGTWLGYPNEWPVVELPEDWTSQPDGTLSPAAQYQMSLESTVEGPGEVTLRWYAGGPSANTAEEGAFVTADHRITWTTLACQTNTPPTTPGQVQASTTVTRTGVSLSWEPSIDPDGDPITYTLETRDQDDPWWNTVLTGLTGTSIALADPPEGRRIYRVTAVEQGTHEPLEQSLPGPPSATVVVDRGVPNPPTATMSRAPEHLAADGTRWWRDNVGITFASAGDPKLPDGSAGSGVVSVTGTTTVAAAGAFTRTGTARDAAGNTASSTVAGALDTVHPSIALACPAEVTLGSTPSSASATWTASDEAGGSGLATAASGQLALDTSTVGTRTATLPSGHARDRVGHLSEATGCSYRVVYPFAGFFRSVDTDRVNVAKAGRAVALSFSLGGNRGLGVLSGAPTFTVTGGPLAGEEIVQSGKLPGPGLTYDAATGQYTYLWQTDRAWLNKSGTVSVRLTDGTVHTAVFSFK